MGNMFFFPNGSKEYQILGISFRIPTKMLIGINVIGENVTRPVVQLYVESDDGQPVDAEDCPVDWAVGVLESVPGVDPD